MSDTQAYRQFGNAVVVPVVEFLAEAMKPYLAQALSSKTGKPANAPPTDVDVGRMLVEADG